MNGHVDADGRALVSVSLRSVASAAPDSVQAWIDTGFNGNLVLPQRDWFGEDRDLEVVANDGEHALLGVGLLVGYDLHISYRTGDITIE
jgi:predicted aspartyl protease